MQLNHNYKEISFQTIPIKLNVLWKNWEKNKENKNVFIWRNIFVF